MTWLILTAAAAPDRVSAEAAAPLISDTLKVTLAAPDGGTVEEGKTGHFEVSVTGSTTEGAVTVRYSISGTAVAGEDYTALSGEATVAQGDSRARIALAAIDDGILDIGETVVLTLTTATGPATVVADQTPAKVTILDDGSLSVSLTPMPDTIGEGSAWSSTVRLSTPVADQVSVRWWTTDGTALAGRDYTAADEVVSFQPGETSKPISVQTLQDAVAEPVEVFYVSLDPASLAAGAATASAASVNADARAAFIQCTVAFPDDVQTMFTLNENVPSGTVVDTVAAETHSIAFYSITGGQNKFAINSVTGEIRTTGTLNRSSYHITVSVSDDCGGSDSVHVTIKVNRTPDADAGDDQTVVEKDEVILDGTGSTDPDDDDLEYSWTGPLTLANPNTATPRFTAPDVDKTTRYKFTLTVTDPGGLSDSDDVTITVEENGDPDVEAEASPNPAKEGTTVSLVGDATDPQGDRMNYRWEQTAGAPQVSITNSTSLGASFRAPDVDQDTDLTFELTAKDWREGSGSASVTVTVLNDQAPVFDPASYSAELRTTASVGDPVTTVYAKDPEGKKVTYSLSGSDKFRIDANSGEITVAGTLSATTYNLTATAKDPALNEGTAPVKVVVKTPPDEAPVFKPSSYSAELLTTAAVDDPVTTVYAEDPEGKKVTYSLSGSDKFRIDANSGEITVAGTLSATMYNLTATAKDPALNEGTAPVKVVVKTPPDEAPVFKPSSYSAKLLTTASVDDHVVTVSAKDPEGKKVTYSLSGSNKFQIDANGGEITVAGSLDATTYNLTATARDPARNEGTASVKITVEPGGTTCTAPIANAGNNRTARELRRVTLDGSGSTGESSYAWKQVGGRTVTLSDADTATPWFDTPLVSADEVLTFRLTVTTDCDTTTDTDDVRVTIRDNRAPEPKGTIPAQPVRKGESGTVSVSGYFQDRDGDALTYTATSSATGVASVSVTGSTVKYTGKTVGSAQVTVMARDRYGATAKQEFRVTVTTPPPTNRAPVIESVIPARAVVAGDSVAVRVSPHFSDPDSDALTYTASSSARTVATVRVSNDTVWVRGVSKGSADVTVAAADPRGLSVSQDFKVTVSQGNAAPEVVSAIPAMTLAAGDSMVVDVSSHFRDPDADALIYEAQSSNESAATVKADGSEVTVRGVSPGESRVTVTARDTHGASASQGFDVTVEEANEAPEVVKPIRAMTLAPKEHSLVDLAEHFYDPDGDDLGYGAVSLNESVATVRVREDRLTVTGVLRGASPVTVTAEDGRGGSVSLEFVATVPNRAPERLGTIPDRTIERGDTASVAVPGYFGDLEGDTLTYTAVSSDGDVVAVGMAGNRARFEGIRKGVAKVTVTADDGHGGRTDQEFVVTVEGANEPPRVAGAIPALTVARGETVVVDASPHFRDPDGDTLRYEASSSNEAAATVKVSGSEVLVTGVSRGESLVTVTARDPEGASVSQAFLATVPNTPPVAVGSLDPLTLDHGTSALVEVSSAFSDPDGDSLAYRASSSDGNVVHVAARGSQVAVNGLKRGEATVTVTADDGHGGTVEQAFEVTVRNAAPRFGLPAYEREVAENSAAGTAVGDPVTAFDTGGDALTYSFAGQGGGPFGIVASSGQITVAAGAAPDYERGDTLHAVRVVASDGTLADTVGVTIRVTDVPAPGKPAAPTVTGGTGEVEVSWSAPANEGPEITNYDLRYRAKADGDWTEPTAVGAVLADKITGLDAGTTYEAQVRAKSSEGASEWSEPGEGTTDPDNRSPSFDAETYEREVPENSAPGTEVGAPVTATDDDQDDLTYSLVTGGDEAPFVIDGATGQVKVAEGAALDYESGKTAYEVSVRASDGTLAATAAVTIRVTDVPAPGKPDAPTVTGGTEEVEVSWTAPVNEGLEITDYDLRYRAKPGGEWKDAPVVGAMLTHTITGLEAGTTYEAQVRAISSEGAGEWSEPGAGTTDPDNRAPSFDAEAYEREVPENSAPGTVVGEPVTATDDDQDDLTYRFAAGGEAPFEIDGTTGRITVAEGAALNYESADTLFTVRVEASDGELADTASVTIRVTNADDPGTVTLDPEVARVGVEMTATLTDEDGVRGGGTSRKWQRSANGSAWNDVGRGRMYNPVTSDAGRWLRVVFTYSDRHGPGKWAVSAALKVQPGNAAPSFAEDAYEREVPENSPGGTAVGEPVTATDGDNDDLTYAFVPGGAEVPFEIDGETGRIAVAEDVALNYESGDTLHAVRVEARDGTLADTATVTIRVTNADDPGTVTLDPEVARVGVEMTATLTDEDGVRNAGRQRRWQRSANGNSWNEVGRGRMYNPVTADEGKWLRLVITYSDGHGSGKRAVSAAVKVLPANARPSFGAAYEREVPENSPGGTNVGAPVAATDPDSPSLSYSFAEGGDEALFGIVEATGQITVADGAALDYESGDTLLAVRVEASDGELADTASVKIRVTNADDPGKIALS
ncbi:MAG: cadherin domain-containing protein, partial [Gemmatimonadetes bacterium]|nr:cadherin domain-containing protein [Candidatus Palauibacter australiensis]